MSSELIERLAHEAGFDDAMEGRGIWTGETSALRRFAALVAEECAKTAEAKGPELIRWWGDGQANAAAMECAADIRAKFPVMK